MFGDKAYPRGEVLNGNQLVSVVALYTNLESGSDTSNSGKSLWPSIMFGVRLTLEEKS